MRASTRLIVFARAPIPGRAKTRLVPALGAEGAAELQAVLVRDTLARARAADVGAVELWGADDDHGLLESLARSHDISYRCQGEGDLGARMRAALAEATEAGGRALIIGSDCPALTPAMIASASDQLERADAVLVPARDGGYVLLGLHRVADALFQDMPWGSDAVLSTTRERLSGLGWNWRELAAVGDVDRPEDLSRLAEEDACWAQRLRQIRGDAEPGRSGRG